MVAAEFNARELSGMYYRYGCLTASPGSRVEMLLEGVAEEEGEKVLPKPL